MQVLAAAYGPLLLEHELVDLLKQIPLPVSWNYEKLRDILTTASRLIVGDGENQGFSLIHPRLNDYFQAELAKNPAHQRQVHEAYLNWGAAVVTCLNQNQLMPDSCPRYLLDHYTDHIAAVHLEPNFALENYWLPLLEGGWHQAWEAYEGAWNGLLSDLERVFEVLRQYNQACYERGERIAMKLAAEVRCALIRASIYTLIQNIPAELVVNLVEADIWPLSRAERVALQFEPKKQVDCLFGLAKITLPSDNSRLLQQILIITGNIHDDEGLNVQILTKLVPHLVGKPDLLREALSTAWKLREGNFTEVLIILAPQLGSKPDLLEQALSLVGHIQDKYYRSRALIALAHHLLSEPVLQRALIIVENFQDKEYRAQVLTILASQLAGKPNLLQRALTIVENIENIQDEENRVRALTALAVQSAGNPDLLQRALTITKKIQGEKYRSQALTRLAPQLASEPDLLQYALTIAKNILDEKYRTQALNAVENIQNEK
ncbi:MAG: hypothetical protein HC877_13950 [Thioploca sp.]|nr:hypothetical protein [Thioploca sp.]